MSKRKPLAILAQELEQRRLETAQDIGLRILDEYNNNIEPKDALTHIKLGRVVYELYGAIKPVELKNRLLQTTSNNNQNQHSKEQKTDPSRQQNTTLNEHIRQTSNVAQNKRPMERLPQENKQSREL